MLLPPVGPNLSQQRRKNEAPHSYFKELNECTRIFRTGMFEWVERGGRKEDDHIEKWHQLRERGDGNHSYLLKMFDSCILKSLCVGPLPQKRYGGGVGSGVRHAPLSNVEIQEQGEMR